MLVRLGSLARPGDDLIGLNARILEPLAVLGEQRVGFLTRLLGVLDRVIDHLDALVERVADRREGELVEHDQGHAESEQRPDHQP